MAIFTFTNPFYLLFLFAIPLFFAIHFLSLSTRKKKALNFANFDAIAKIQGVDFFSKNIVMLFLNIIIIFFLVLAVSGLTLHVSKQASAFTFVVAIDSSQSMEADDFVPNRLEASKNVASDFVESVPFGSKFGVISFSGSSFIEQDITQEKSDIIDAIDQIEISGFGGTDLFEATITASNILRDEEGKAIIFLSDGQINVGTVDDVIDFANANDILIHTIAIGTKEGGLTTYAISKVDEDSLKSVAFGTGGEFFSAETEQELSDSFADVFQLTKRKVSIPLFNYLMITAIVLFILGFFLRNTRYLNLP